MTIIKISLNMGKLWITRANLYSFWLVLATIMLFFGFHLAWTSLSSMWFKAILILCAFAFEDCIVLWLCLHHLQQFLKNANTDSNELSAISNSFLLCFPILAITFGSYAWVNIYLFLFTIIMAVLFFFEGVCIIGIHDEVKCNIH